jgi:hypothetical protein
MQSITPKKCLFELPQNLGRFRATGRTSIFYLWDHQTLVVYSIDHPKFAYWKHIGLTHSITLEGQAIFKGWNRLNVYESYTVNVWSCKVPRLYPVMGYVVRSYVQAAKNVALYASDSIEMWTRIANIRYMRDAAEFALFNDPDDLSFDMRVNEMLVWNGRVIPIDPFVSFAAYLPISLIR